MIKIIACVGKNLELGKKGNLIWDLPQDLKFFKEQTLNKTVVMGSVTYNSLPRKLPNRKHIVLSYDDNFNKDTKDVTVIYKPEELFTLCYELSKKEDVYIIGGASIYKMFIDKADELILTEINAECDSADVYFPVFDKTKYIRRKIGNGQDKNIKYKHIVYTKIK